MKKILFIHHGTISVGAGLSALHIVQNLAKDQYEITVCMPRGEGDLKDKFTKMGVKVRTVFSKNCSYTHVNGYHYPIFSCAHVHNIVELFYSRNILKKILQEEVPDIVMVNSMTLFWMGKYAKEIGAKTVCFHRETYCRGLLGVRTAFIKKRLNQDFEQIAFLSNYDLKQTGKCYEKYMRITDKVDCSLYEKLDKTECRRELGLPEGQLILFTGGISELKGIKVLLQAVTHMKTTAKVIIMQYTPLSKKAKGIRGLRQMCRRMFGRDTSYWVKQFIDRNNLKDKLILRERTDAIEKYFIACDLVVFPSQEAHQARPVFEAGVARRPIIVSNFKNTDEFLNATNGWRVRYNDVGGWAAACDVVLEGDDKTVSKVQENYRRTMAVNQLEQLQKELRQLLEKLNL